MPRVTRTFSAADRRKGQIAKLRKHADKAREKARLSVWDKTGALVAHFTQVAVDYDAQIVKLQGAL